MREVKFRGYHKASNTWVYGDLIRPRRGNVRAVILVSAACNGGWLMPLERYAVDPASIGEYVGKVRGFDDVYTGDWVRTEFNLASGFPGISPIHEGRIHYDESRRCYGIKAGAIFVSLADLLGNHWGIQTTGKNIHDNPELLP